MSAWIVQTHPDQVFRVGTSCLLEDKVKVASGPFVCMGFQVMILKLCVTACMRACPPQCKGCPSTFLVAHFLERSSVAGCRNAQGREELGAGQGCHGTSDP
jgi:hypothetical protein